VRFRPDRCPRPDCPSSSSGHRRWCRKGRFLRVCDGRLVQRFLCLECKRTFSTQTFRVDYRMKKPRLNLSLLGPFISKVTHRQAARVLGCSRGTVAHRLELLGEHCERFHRWRLSKARGKILSSSIFQLDELETFEHNRRLAPVTVPVLLERKSYFVIDLKTASLPARGGLRKRDRERKEAREKMHGRRKSGSVRAVEGCIRTLSEACPIGAPIRIQTDRKETYPSILKRHLKCGIVHERHSSTARRDYANPLFPINHTLAMMRDGISRLVRRTWAASKLKEKLERHAWIWAVWRNYVRTVTNRTPGITPAIALGIEEKRWRMSEICAWKVFQTA
jgi:transposase-like protein